MTNATTTTKTTLKYLDGTNGLIIRVIISIINTHTHTQIHSHAYTFNVTHHCQQFKSSQLFKKKKLEWTNRHTNPRWTQIIMTLSLSQLVSQSGVIVVHSYFCRQNIFGWQNQFYRPAPSLGLVISYLCVAHLILSSGAVRTVRSVNDQLTAIPKKQNNKKETRRGEGHKWKATIGKE